MEILNDIDIIIKMLTLRSMINHDYIIYTMQIIKFAILSNRPTCRKPAISVCARAPYLQPLMQLIHQVLATIYEIHIQCIITYLGYRSSLQLLLKFKLEMLWKPHVNIRTYQSYSRNWHTRTSRANYNNTYTSK